MGIADDWIWFQAAGSINECLKKKNKTIKTEKKSCLLRSFDNLKDSP